MYLLDTDTCIYLLNDKLPRVEARLREVSAAQVGITAVSAAELRFGALNSGRPGALGGAAALLDLCELFEHAKPAEADPVGEGFTIERGASKHGGGDGWADVSKRGFFAWEYKPPGLPPTAGTPTSSTRRSSRSSWRSTSSGRRRGMEGELAGQGSILTTSGRRSKSRSNE